MKKLPVVQMVQRGGVWYASDKEYKGAIEWASKWPAELPFDCDNTDHLRNFYNESRANGFEVKLSHKLLRVRRVTMTEDFNGGKFRWCTACCQNDADMIHMGW